MKYLHPAPLTAAFLLCGVSLAMASDFKVICNTDIKMSDISVDDLKRVFLSTKSSLPDGTHAEPVWEKAGATHEAFLKEYVGKTDAALGTYFRSLVFTGKASMPISLGSDAEVVAYVAKTKGGIGYVAAGTKTEGVKVLEVK